VLTGWTITGLRPSSDRIPHPVAGRLWAATARVEAIRGTLTPIVADLNARAQDGENYRVVYSVTTPQGVNPSNLTEGGQTSAKIYYDVVGADPDRVVYNNGIQDLLIWPNS
jgi:hypothetical protein